MNIINEWLDRHGDKEIEEKVKLILSNVSKSFICHDADTYGKGAKCSEMCVDCRNFNKNENKLGMCNCCGDNNCHDDFCKGQLRKINNIDTNNKIKDGKANNKKQFIIK